MWNILNHMSPDIHP
jgi:hypothetical protein